MDDPDDIVRLEVEAALARDVRVIPILVEGAVMPTRDDIPELVSLGRTISRWEDQIVCAVLTGITNATSESLNRLAKLEARLAYGFRNPANQRRRVRIACTRGTRRPSRTATARRTRQVIGRKPHPG